MIPPNPTQTEGRVRRWTLFVCPDCGKHGLWRAHPTAYLPGGPALCHHPSSGYTATEVWEAAPLRAVLREWAKTLPSCSEAESCGDDLFDRLRDAGIEPFEADQ